MAEATAVKFCTQVGFVKFYQKNKVFPKVVWLWSRDLFKFLVPPTIPPEWLKLETSNCVQWFTTGGSLALGLQTVPWMGVVMLT